MFKKIEHISNSIGKTLLQVLFILAILSNCISCAKYIITKKDNFQCPICSYFNGLNNPLVRVNYKHIPIVFQVNNTNFQKQTNDTKKLEKKIVADEQESNSRTFNKFVVLIIPLNYKPIITQKVIANQPVKLFLLYHQLKIGDYKVV